MRDACYAKFSQNEKLKRFLMSDLFEGKIFVEASPYDKIWGICLSENTPENILTDKSKWLGKNLLGNVLNEVRVLIKNN